MPYDGGWAPYVPVAERRRRALRKMTQLRKKGMDIRPIEIEGRKIARTFWGQAWCDHMESLGDFANRLPRGRTYVRNGSVCHLAIKKGGITAMVSGSSLYNIKVKIGVLPKKKWTKVKSRCAGQIGSLLELLQGRFSDNVMDVVTDSHGGLFPLSKEIHLSCSCPDWATMCKHVAAVLYGVGARLDEQPDLLFLLRGVKHDELISANATDAVNLATRRGGKRPTLDSGELGEVFGIEFDTVSEQNSRSAGSKLPKKSTGKRASALKKKLTKKKLTTTRHKKSKASKKSDSKKKTATKKASSKTTPHKTVTTASAKIKAATKRPRKNSAKKTVTKPTKKKAKRTRTLKKKTSARTIKKSSANKRDVKTRSQSVKKTSAKKK
jgi:uncharacterized Zn finger protein